MPSKQGFLYVFDRQTGQPVWPIVERPVEKGTVPGEWYSPTQPFPTKPPPFELQGVQEKDLIDFTPELLAEAKKVAANIKLGPLFTPPIPRGEGGKIGTAYIANGANWPGGSYDPETGILYVYSNTLTRLLILANDPKRSDMDFINTGGGGDTGVGGGGAPGCNLMPCAITVQGLPFVKPPWGRITAIDLKTGEMVWQVPHGETLDAVTNHPMLKGVTIPRTGRIGPIGTLTTKTLIVSGERGFTTPPSGQRFAKLYAYDKATGREVANVAMPAPQTGNPMTYMLNGKQYLVRRDQRAGFSCGADCLHGRTLSDQSTGAGAARSSYASALWVLAGLSAGILLGILASVSASPWLLALVRSVEPIGAIFVNAIRMAVVPLVVASLIVGVVSITDQRSLTRLGLRSLMVFAALAISAAVIATVAAAPILAQLDIDPSVAERLRQPATAGSAVADNRTDACAVVQRSRAGESREGSG